MMCSWGREVRYVYQRVVHDAGGTSAPRIASFHRATNVVLTYRCSRVATGETYAHNKHYRKIIGKHRPDWQKAKNRDERDEIARQIIASIASLKPPGKFLRKTDGGGGASSNPNGNGRAGSRPGSAAATAKKLWYPVEKKCAMDKIQQALRDMAKPPPPSSGEVEPLEVSHLAEVPLILPSPLPSSFFRPDALLPLLMFPACCS
jgi:hypothetical protein